MKISRRNAGYLAAAVMFAAGALAIAVNIDSKGSSEPRGTRAHAMRDEAPHAIAGLQDRGPDAVARRGGKQTSVADARKSAKFPVLLPNEAHAQSEGGLEDMFIEPTPFGDGYLVFYKSGLEIRATPTNGPLNRNEYLQDKYPMDTPEGTVSKVRYTETVVRDNEAFISPAFTQTLEAGEVNRVPAVLTWCEATTSGYVTYTLAIPGGTTDRLLKIAAGMSE